MPINKNTFCVAPWYSVFLDSKRRIAPCCKFKNPQDKTIEEYFTSKELAQVRKDLLSGVRNKNCAKCWADEENKGDSLRLISNRTIAHAENLDLSKQIEDPQLEKILSFDLTLGNLCNLKCVMCSPELSSKILAEANANENLKTLYDKEANYVQKSFDWPENEEFINWCTKHLANAIHIKFTGGEPFIIPWIEKVISEIPDHQKAKCILHFTSNLTVVNEKLFAHFSKFKEVWISVSVEGIEETFEYMRHGHTWTNFRKNLSAVVQMKIPNLILKINHVIQSPSFHSIPKMIEFFDKLEIEIHPILLTSPRYFTLNSLTESCKQDFLSASNNYNGYNNKFMAFVKNVVKSAMKHERENTNQMIKHLDTLDRVRKNDHNTIIPKANIN